MDPQDQKIPSTPPISSVFSDTSASSIPASSIPVSPPVTTVTQSGPTPTPFPVDRAPTYGAEHVLMEGNPSAVPQESIGLDSVTPGAFASGDLPGVIPNFADRLVAPAEVFPEDASPSQGAPPPPPSPPSPQQPSPPSPSSSSGSSPSLFVPEPADVPVQQDLSSEKSLADSPTESTEELPVPLSTEEQPEEVGESQKTPLEILEEILASANEPPSSGTGLNQASVGETPDPEAAAREKERAEAEEKKAEALAAETTRYQQEVEQRIALAQQDIQEAAQQRAGVTEQLQSEGKQVGATVSTPEDQVLAIQQLEHDTLTQKSE